jgi:hypothetical protein
MDISSPIVVYLPNKGGILKFLTHLTYQAKPLLLVSMVMKEDCIPLMLSTFLETYLLILLAHLMVLVLKFIKMVDFMEQLISRVISLLIQMFL